MQQQFGNNRIPGRQASAPGTRQTSVAQQQAQGGGIAQFADSWLSRLLIGGAVLLLIVMFPLQWLRVPDLTVRAGSTVFAPRPGAAAGADGQTVAGTLTAAYDLSEAAGVTAVVRDANDTVVRTLFSGQQENSGPHWLSWDGANDAGQAVPDGLYRLEVTAQGPARSASGSVAVRVDTVPPPLKLANLADGDKLKDADLTLQGVTEPGATVQFADSNDVVTADPGGGFTLHRQLAHGENRLRIIARDAAGNETTVERTVSLFDRPPVVTVDSPAEGAWTNQKLLHVTGTADPGATIRVNDQQTTPGADGRFALDVLLDEGRNVLKIEAVDAVGNVATVQQTVTLKTQPPVVQIDSLPADAVVHEARARIYGHTDPGVKLSVQGQPVIVDTQGRFDTAVDLITGDNTIHIEASDPAGNVTAFDRRVRYDLTSGTDIGLPLTGTVVGVGLVILLWVFFGGWFGTVSLRLHTDRATFSPTGRGERLHISYSVSKGARVSIQVVDRAGHVVATLLRNAPQGVGDHEISWDGEVLGGGLAAPGTHTIVAGARTLSSHVTSSAPVLIQPPPRYAVGTVSRFGDPAYGAPRPPPRGGQGAYGAGAEGGTDPGAPPGPQVVRRRQ